MPTIRPFAERTLQFQLQRLIRFRPPVPLFVALVVFSCISITRHASSASAPALPTAPWKALPRSGTSDGIPVLNSLLNIITCALNTACIRAWIQVKVPIQWREAFNWGAGKPRSDDDYATPRAVAKYWRVAGRYRRRLYGGNGPTSPSARGYIPSRDSTAIPLVTYYTPRLLPLYRDRGGNKHTSREMDRDAQRGRISPRTFCKWHRMVFQDSLCHPSFAQAAMQMKYYSNRDLREIHRIARLLPDEEVLGRKGKGARKLKRTTKYSEMWQSWLENKGMDLVIVFE